MEWTLAFISARPLGWPEYGTKRTVLFIFTLRVVEGQSRDLQMEMYAEGAWHLTAYSKFRCSRSFNASPYGWKNHLLLPLFAQ